MVYPIVVSSSIEEDAFRLLRAQHGVPRVAKFVRFQQQGILVACPCSFPFSKFLLLEKNSRTDYYYINPISISNKIIGHDCDF